MDGEKGLVFLFVYCLILKKKKNIRRLCCHTVSFENFQSEKIWGSLWLKKKNILMAKIQGCEDKRKYKPFALFGFSYIFFLKSALFGADRVNE